MASSAAGAFVPTSIVAPTVVAKAVNIRGGAIMTNEQYVKTTSGIFGFYALQMILAPKKLVDDHFEGEATDMDAFAWRGHGVTSAALAYSLWINAGADMSKTLSLAWMTGIALAYPLNAKFNILGNYKVKYPMHYVPEVLMTSMIALGFLSQ